MAERSVYSCFLLATVVATVAVGCSREFSGPCLPQDLSDEYGLLLNVDTFFGAHVGFGGITPPAVLAFRVLLDDPRGDYLFKSLVCKATIPGRLYGLAGIYFTDPAAFEREIELYLESCGMVKTMFGCIVADQEIRVIAERILRGELPAELAGIVKP